MPGRPRLLDHRLEHLAGADDGLAKLVALGDQHNLCGDLNSHVATGNYGTITCLVDFGLVLDSLLIIDLGDDPDVLAFLMTVFALAALSHLPLILDVLVDRWMARPRARVLYYRAERLENILEIYVLKQFKVINSL